jgi:hypothetical protein
MSVSVANDVSPGVMNERVDLFKRKERFKIPPKVPQQIQSFYEAMGVPPSYYLNKKTQAERLRRSESLKTVKEMQKEIDKTDNPFINVLVRIKDDFEEDNSNRVKNASLALSHWKNQLVPMIAFKDEKSLIVFKYFRRLIPPRTSQRVSFQTIVPPKLIDNFFHGLHTNIMFYGGIGSGKSYSSFGAPESMTRAEDHCKENFGLQPHEILSSDHGVFLQLCNVLIKKKNDNNKTLCRAVLTLSCVDVRFDKCCDVLNEYRSVMLSETNGDFIGSTEINISTFMDALRVASKIEKSRKERIENKNIDTGSTVFSIKLTNVDTANKCVRVSKLQMFDLVSSKVPSNKTLYQIERMKRIQTFSTNEGTVANVELMHILLCMQRTNLAEIPYQDFNITRLLCDTFNCQAFTCLVINISQKLDNVKETYNSLRYGSIFSQLPIAQLPSDTPTSQNKKVRKQGWAKISKVCERAAVLLKEKKSQYEYRIARAKQSKYLLQPANVDLGFLLLEINNLENQLKRLKIK